MLTVHIAARHVLARLHLRSSCAKFCLIVLLYTKMFVSFLYQISTTDDGLALLLGFRPCTNAINRSATFPLAEAKPTFYSIQPQDTLPIHPVYKVADWDDPEGAIDWPRFSTFLHDVKRTGVIPDDHNSHDHMNIQKEVSFDGELIQSWRKKFEEVQRVRGVRVRWVMVDGFLLYWQQVSLVGCLRL